MIPNWQTNSFRVEPAHIEVPAQNDEFSVKKDVKVWDF